VFLGAGEPTISRLLHAAALISQQISLGQCQYEAFLSSCCDVYVKSCVRSASGSAGFSDFKQKLYQLLKDVLNDITLVQKTHRNPLEDKFKMDVCTLTTSRVKENASFAVVKQQGSLLKTSLEAVVSSESEHSEESMKTGDMNLCSNTETLNELLDVRNESIIGSKVLTVVKLVDVIPSFLLMFYERAAENDIQLRHEWVVELISKCRRKCQETNVNMILEKYQKMSELLKRTLFEAFSSQLNFHENLVKCICNISDLPWDIRWLPDIAAFCDPKCFACRAVNKLVLLLCFIVKKIQTERVTGQIHSSKQNSLTVKEYSTAFLHGMLAVYFSLVKPFTN
jgi:hypothetical protein